MGLVGTLPPQLGNLSFLVSLNISRNHFHGNLPRELANLRRLQFMDFGYNDFGGKIPEEIGNLEKAKWVILEVNQLDGPIPFTIFNISTLQILILKNNSLSSSLPTKICHYPTRLKVLRLSFNQLNGDIPKNLSSCSELEDLRLGYNNLVGTIPRDIGSLNMLQILTLARNNLEGTIPETMFNISALTVIQMGNNSLSGILPPSMRSHLQNLEELYLFSNKLYGNIPRSIGECSKLKYLYMGENQLHGLLPRQIGNLTMLKQLNLAKNFLSGIIPETIFNISALTVVSMRSNNLYGILPPKMCSHLQNLEELYLHKNKLYGNIPTSIGECFSLKELVMWENQLNGPLPRQIGNLSMLNVVSLSENSLSGEIPREFGKLDKFEFLDLSVNGLSGSIPWEIFNISTLESLSLASNNLSGTLPTSLGHWLPNLEELYLGLNYIEGLIPAQISNASNLVILDLSQNEFAGFILNSLGNLARLEWLNLFSNNLTTDPQFGLITSLANCRYIQELLLSDNPLNTLLPNTIGNFSTTLQLFSAYNCNIRGRIPQEIGNLTNLYKLNLRSNDIIGFLPTNIHVFQSLQVFDLSQNILNGSFPDVVCELHNLYWIGLAKNKFSGPISDCLGNVSSLIRLIDFSVAHNTIRGSIPEAVGKLLDIHSLDLSDNNFSGMIPKSLEGLISMKYFNVSYNKLTGEIPSEGPFANFTYESFLSNDGLCGNPRMHVPPCPAKTLHTSKKNRVVLFALVSLAILIVLVASVTSYLIFRRRKRELLSEPDLLSAITPTRFSYYELQQATNGFDETNLLGSGSFGSVYKAILTNGMNVAVKVFGLIHEGNSRSFDTECQVLRNIRHRNLTKVLGSCSNNLDFKALVLEYMPYGSLHKWLYSHNYFLDMIKRVSIMIDVASALEYLHYGYSEPIIHCDLKPGNVLIDADMVGHLSDFGVAKLLGDGNSIAITNTLATIGYIAPVNFELLLEYGQEGLVSTRSDMYSYGIMLLEVFTRIQPGDEMFNAGLCLKSWVQNALPTNISQIIDSNLLEPNEENYDEKLQCVLAIFELGIKCSTESPRERITIKDVLSTLKKIKGQLLLHKNLK